MPHNEFQSVSRMKENFTYGLTGRDWKSVYGLVNKSLRNRKGGATGYQTYEIRRQSFTLLGVLVQILAENIKQLVQLEQILEAGKENIDLINQINAGKTDSLAMIRTISPYINPGQYGELRDIQDVLQKFGIVFGTAVNSPDAPAQRSVDTAVAEAVTMDNAIFDYTKQTDDIGEQIKKYSHEASPGGAARLTAESLGVILHVMNQQLRAQGVLLKLQAQGLAQSNKRDKDHSAEYLKSADDISTAMEGANPTFERPRF